MEEFKEGFKEGDIVVIRDWHEMENEYGLRGRAINCEAGFIPEMRHLCNKFAIIHRFLGGRRVDLRFSEEEPGKRYDWNFSLDMIEKFWDKSDAYIPSEESLINFVTGE